MRNRLFKNGLIRTRVLSGIGLLLVVALLQASTITAQTAGPPYGSSPVITGLQWEAAGTIPSQASGSDVWVMSWAEDGHLYTAYGDGWGFEPKVDQKLSWDW